MRRVTYRPYSSLQGYMWVTASRSLLAEHIRAGTDTSRLRAGSTGGGTRVLSRSLREAGTAAAAAAAAASSQKGPTAGSASLTRAAGDAVLLPDDRRPAAEATVAGSTAGLADDAAPGGDLAVPVTVEPAQFGHCRGPTVNETVPRLVSVRRWRSSRGRRRESITLVTQLSLER